MAMSRKAWDILTDLDFQARCEFDDDAGKRCRRYATWALFKVECNCKESQRVWLACNKCRRWMFALEPAQCTDCDFMFEPNGRAAFDQVQRLVPKG